MGPFDAASQTPSVETVAEQFHRLNRVIPDTQTLTCISPSTSVEEALKLMKKTGFSQLPVLKGKMVLGMFSHRSFAEQVRKDKKLNKDFSSLRVEDFVEEVEFARVNQEFKTIFTWLDRDGAVLIGDPELLQSVVTPMDLLKYLYDVANPFVLLAEIELAVRALISRAVDGEQLALCALETLTSKYGEGKVPTSLNDMTFSDYAQIVGSRKTWDHFSREFGSSREMVKPKLDDINELRNNVFHFKRELGLDDHERLGDYRNWALRRIRLSEYPQKGEQA